MRLAIKETLLLLALYAVGSAVVIFGAYRALDSAATGVMEEIARLVGREVVSTVSDSLVDDALGPGPRDDEAVLASIRGLARGSEMVRSVTLVGPGGEVIATDDPDLSGPSEAAVPESRLPLPNELFAEDRRTRFVNLHGPGLGTGTYQMEIPLPRGGEPAAYLRLVLESDEINRLYNDTRHRLFLAAAFGLAVIGVLGFLLHVQVRRRERWLLHTLEDAIEGREIRAGSPSTPSTDQFRLALDAAGRLGRELQTYRERQALSERRLSRVAQVMDVGVLMLDADRRPEFASDRARELVGGEDEDSWRTRVAEWMETLDKTPNGLPEKDREIEVPLPEEGRTLRLGIHPLDDEPGYLVMVRDAQVTRALEADLQLASQLRGLMGLYMGIAHDLKAPLNAMVLNLELLKRSLGDGADGGPTAKQLRQIGVLEEESRRLRRSVERLLAQTAPTRGETVRFDLAQLVGEVGELLAPQARQQKVDLEVEVPRDRLLTWGSPDLTKQALINVAVNGFEALADGGRLRIEAEARDGKTVVRVSDNGPGIEPHILDRVFDLHFTTKESGTGLGLYVTRAMIEAQGGTLRIAETGPAGTTFELCLPADPKTRE